MKIICVGDAYVTKNMMRNGVGPFLSTNDRVVYSFFGQDNRADMRETVKNIESMKRDFIEIPNELFYEIEDADLLLVHLCPVTKTLLSKAKKLKAILSCRGGCENIDVDYASQKGIIVATNPAHNANAVAEYTIGLIICEIRNICRSDRSLKNGLWRENYPNTETKIRELKDLTIGIIGFGSVGRLVAEKLQPFGCKVIIYDPYISESAYDFINFKFVTKDALLTQSDVISLHARSQVPILVTEDFSKMGKRPYIINTARSVLIEPSALFYALDNNLILGGAIDVFETEPEIPAKYTQYDALTITNHRGGDTINSYEDSPAFAIKNYLDYLSGGRLKFWVNKDIVKSGQSGHDS